MFASCKDTTQIFSGSFACCAILSNIPLECNLEATINQKLSNIRSITFQHGEMLGQRRAIEQQRQETLATEQRVEDLYNEIKLIRGT